MALSFALVDGAAFADDASRILEEAWDPPAPRYTPSYLAWQMGFPSAGSMPAAAAFDAGEPVGFAAATARRLRAGASEIDAAVVSFVAVRRAWRGRRVATGLYQVLLAALAERGTPVVTYGIPGSAGEKTLLRAYPEAGFQMRPIGAYPAYAFAARPGASADGAWTARFSEEAGLVTALAEAVVEPDGSVLWSAPENLRMAHYFRDPRPRKLMIAEHLATRRRAAAFVINAELRTAQGFVWATTLDSVWIPDADAGALAELLRLALTAWPAPEGSRPVVMCPNLSGFDAAALKAAGLRRTAAQFNGYFCSPGERSYPAVERTNLEIV